MSKTKQPAHASVRHPVLPALPAADPFIGFAQAARAIGVPESVLEGIVKEGRMPKPIRHTEGGRRYFRQSAVIAYINSLEKRSKP